jgi:transcriptional regulator with XRE-family HTH domain
MPSAISSELRALGANLAIARKRRKQSIENWASRIGVSAPTVARMESGDPSVGMGIYATALWMIGRSQQIPALADPSQDLGALEDDIREAQQRAVRQAPSISQRLAQDSPTRGVGSVKQVLEALRASQTSTGIDTPRRLPEIQESKLPSPSGLDRASRLLEDSKSLEGKTLAPANTVKAQTQRQKDAVNLQGKAPVAGSQAKSLRDTLNALRVANDSGLPAPGKKKSK